MILSVVNDVVYTRKVGLITCDKVNLLDCVTYKVFSFHAFQELVLDYVMTLC